MKQPSPGPWTVELDTDDKLTRYMLDRDGREMFNDWGRDVDHDEADANWRLMRHALQLLEASTFARDRLSDLPLACRSPEERLNELETWIQGEILPMLNDAIEKAAVASADQ